MPGSEMLERVQQAHGWSGDIGRGLNGLDWGRGWNPGFDQNWVQGWQGPWFGGFWSVFGTLFWVGLLVLLALLLARLIFGGGPRTSGPPFAQRRDPALEIARERLARGEIDAQTFETIKRALSSP